MLNFSNRLIISTGYTRFSKSGILSNTLQKVKMLRIHAERSKNAIAPPPLYNKNMRDEVLLIFRENFSK